MDTNQTKVTIEDGSVNHIHYDNMILTALSLGLKLSVLESLPARGEGELHKEKEENL